MQNERHSPARLIAPLALVLFALAFFAVLITAGAGDDSGGDKKKAQTTERTARKKPKRTQTTTTAPATTQASYTVKTGDTLAGIAEDTGVEVEKIQELNPELDPQALVSGQKIKLRE